MPKQIKTIVGELGDFTLYKKGVSGAGKKWALYEGFVNGEKFKTFDSAYLEHEGETKIFLYEEEEKEFTNKEGKLIQYTAKTLLPYKAAKSQDVDPYESEDEKDETPVVEDAEPEIEEPVSTATEDIGAEFVNPEEKIMEALKGDDGWLQKIYKKLVEIVTILEK